MLRCLVTIDPSRGTPHGIHDIHDITVLGRVVGKTFELAHWVDAMSLLWTCAEVQFLFMGGFLMPAGCCAIGHANRARKGSGITLLHQKIEFGGYWGCTECTGNTKSQEERQDLLFLIATFPIFLHRLHLQSTPITDQCVSILKGGHSANKGKCKLC